MSVEQRRLSSTHAWTLSWIVSLFTSGVTSAWTRFVSGFLTPWTIILSTPPAPGDFAGVTVAVHVLGESANERVVYFGDPVHLLERAGLHGVADSVEHKPCRLLGDAEGASEFMRRDAVLAVGDEPDGGKPLVESERGVLEDRPDLERELLLAPLALPDPTGGDERGLAMSASGAKDLAISPAHLENEVESAVSVGEVADGGNQVGGVAGRFDVSSISWRCDRNSGIPRLGCVK